MKRIQAGVLVALVVIAGCAAPDGMVAADPDGIRSAGIETAADSVSVSGGESAKADPFLGGSH